jgi:hypothetical protein
MRFNPGVKAKFVIQLPTGQVLDDPNKAVEGFTYLLATDLLKTQQDDVIRSFDTALWDNGLSPKGGWQGVGRPVTAAAAS